MDKHRYISEGERQLGDVNIYRPLDSEPTTEFRDQLKTLLSDLVSQGVINDQMAQFSLPDDPRPARFYLLPKVHKQGIPGRLVISGCGSLTEKTSELVDWFLKSYIPSVDSYLKDSFHFLKKLRSLASLHQSSLLVTLDIVNLYTRMGFRRYRRSCCRKASLLIYVKLSFVSHVFCL